MTISPLAMRACGGEKGPAATSPVRCCMSCACPYSHERLCSSLACTTALLPPSPWRQAKEALTHPYFDDLDKAVVDMLESAEVRAREADEADV